MKRETTTGLSQWADLVVALAAASCLPAAARLLPWGVVFALWPHWVDRLRVQAVGRTEIVFVPDPLQPDWRALASSLGAAASLAGAERRTVRVLLCPACGDDGRPLPYSVSYLPERQTLRVQAGTEKHDVKVSWRLRPAIPLPFRVGPQPVALLLAPMAQRRTVLLATPDVRAVARSLPAALLAVALAGLWSSELGAAAALVALTRLAALHASGGRLGWWPWRPAAAGAVAEAARMPAMAGFDVARIWVGGLWLLRFAAGDWSLGRALLHDPLRLYGYGLLLPLMLSRVVRQVAARRRAPAT